MHGGISSYLPRLVLARPRKVITQLYISSYHDSVPAIASTVCWELILALYMIGKEGWPQVVHGCRQLLQVAVFPAGCCQGDQHAQLAGEDCKELEWKSMDQHWINQRVQLGCVVLEPLLLSAS